VLDTDLEQAGDAIHFLLSKQTRSDVLGFLLAGGSAAKAKSRAKGRPAPRGFSAKEVAVLAVALAEIDRDALEASFDLEELAAHRIEPGGWEQERQDDDHVSYVLGYFDVLRSFMASAAKAQAAVIIAFV
jgi:Domain of unknown function (DUF1877)